MAPLTVACVEVGDYLGRGHEYVSILHSMCARHVPEHRFVVLSDELHTTMSGIETILIDGLPKSFWAKVHLFRPGLLTGRVLYLDLDVSISRSLAQLVSLLDEHDFWALDDFAWPLSRAPQLEDMEAQGAIRPGAERIKPLIGGWGTANSSVMLWNGDAGRDVWERYSPEAAGTLDGDQNFVTKIMGDRLKLIPQGWAGSYRYGPENCPITVYHGSPKPHEVYDQNWY